jgi:hypothetical protein
MVGGRATRWVGGWMGNGYRRSLCSGKAPHAAPGHKQAHAVRKAGRQACMCPPDLCGHDLHAAGAARRGVASAAPVILGEALAGLDLRQAGTWRGQAGGWRGRRVQDERPRQPVVENCVPCSKASTPAVHVACKHTAAPTTAASTRPPYLWLRPLRRVDELLEVFRGVEAGTLLLQLLGAASHPGGHLPRQGTGGGGALRKSGSLTKVGGRQAGQGGSLARQQRQQLCARPTPTPAPAFSTSHTHLQAARQRHLQQVWVVWVPLDAALHVRCGCAGVGLHQAGCRWKGGGG